jgi:hypothetical protein
MNKIIIAIAIALHLLAVYATENKGQLANNSIAWQWEMASGRLTSALKDKADGTVLNIQSECFQLVLGDGRTIKASGLKRVGVPRTDELAAEPGSSIAARQFAGRQITLEFSDERDHFMATWQAELRDGANYLQQKLILRARAMS